ncbi:type II secretion system protein GspC [Mixta tenebrionis]|uniref:Type II secretion system protein GspC n=1 Tax=Mixta tenebrionis TaxID=2562439 RepID=A0A506V6M5_9GAMM|nr:type II secretion system protein GspC [Mixta tenebrionis]TPW41206.1 type II secretion system protein GspC [Mixta tenebrionis]
MENGRWRWIDILLIAKLLTLTAIALAGWLMAKISWQLIFPPRAFPDEEINSLSAARALPVIPRGLFGTANSAAQSAATASISLPATSLPLTLTGLLVSDDSRLTLAVILYQGRQASYSAGDKLPVANVSVRQITADGVLLAEPAGDTWLGYPRRPQTAAAQPLSSSLTRQLKQRPGDIADYLSVVPVREGDRLLGYRINPGRKSALFASLGFKPGDLAIAINGADLRDKQQAQHILLQLPQLRTVTVSVERDGQRYEISVALDEEA